MQALHSAQVIFYLTPIIVFLVTVGAAAWRFNIFSGGAREPVVGPGSQWWGQGASGGAREPVVGPGSQWWGQGASGGAREPVVGPGSQCGGLVGPDAVEVGRTGLSGWFEVGLKLAEVGLKLV